MKLEDCTKEELLYYIHRRCLHTSEDVEFDILIFRSEQAVNAETRHSDAAGDCLQEYIDLLSPYAGRKMGDIPLPTLEAAAAAMKRRELNIKKAERERKKYKQISKRMDELLHSRRE